MRHHQRHADVMPLAATLESAYSAQRARVDEGNRRMRAICGGPHEPAEARVAAAELEAAVREAQTTVARLLHQSQPAVAVPRRRWHPRRVDPAAPPTVARWSSELVWLSEIAVWLRRTTLDDLGVHVAATVQVGNYGASGPHIAGLGFGGDAEPPRPRIGVDLRATVDGVHRQPGAPSPPAGAPAPPRAA